VVPIMVPGMIITTHKILMTTDLDQEEVDFKEVHHEIQHSLMVHMVHLMVLLMVLLMALLMALLMVLLMALLMAIPMDHHESQHFMMVHMVLHMVHPMVLRMVHPTVIMVTTEVQTMVHGEMAHEDRIMEIMDMETEGETFKETSEVEEVVVGDLNRTEKKIHEEETKIQSKHLRHSKPVICIGLLMCLYFPRAVMLT